MRWIRRGVHLLVALRSWGKNRGRDGEARQAPVPEVPPAAGYEPETIATAILLVLSNSATRRIVEEISTRGTTVVRKTTIDFVVERAARPHAERLIVPVGAAARGVLWDAEEASCDGRPISTLVHSENALLARAVLGEVWRRAFPHGNPAVDLKERILSLPVQPSDKAAKDLVQIDRELEQLSRVVDAARTHLVEDVRRAANFFARSYIVFAELPQGVGDRVVVTRRVAAPYTVRTLGPLRRWRRSAGLRPVTLTIPLYGSAFRAMSYHLRVKAPDGYHIHFRQLMSSIEGSGGVWRAVPVGVHDFGAVDWSPPGGDHAHLYVAHSAASSQQASRRALVAEVKFAEDLPSSLVGTFASAAILAVLGALSLAYFDRVFGTTVAASGQTAVDQANSSFAAVLLAIPGIASLWFRPRRVDELVRLPLTALVAPVVTGLMSFLIGLVFVGYRLAPCEATAQLVGDDPCNRRAGWTALCVAAAAWAVFLGVRVLSKHSSEEPCQRSWSVRAGRLLSLSWRKIRRASDSSDTDPFPWRPPRWIRRVWTGKVRGLVRLPADPTLDDLYDALVPPSRRGDVYLRRADSFEYPFVLGASQITHATVDADLREMFADGELEATSRTPRGA